MFLKWENDFFVCYFWSNFNKGSGLWKKELKIIEFCKEFFFEDEIFKIIKIFYDEFLGKVDREDEEVVMILFIEEEMEKDIKRKEMEKSEKENGVSYIII